MIKGNVLMFFSPNAMRPPPFNRPFSAEIFVVGGISSNYFIGDHPGGQRSPWESRLSSAEVTKSDKKERKANFYEGEASLGFMSLFPLPQRNTKFQLQWSGEETGKHQGQKAPCLMGETETDWRKSLKIRQRLDSHFPATRLLTR